VREYVQAQKTRSAGARKHEGKTAKLRPQKEGFRQRARNTSAKIKNRVPNSAYM
jgi:hypothetical protein